MNDLLAKGVAVTVGGLLLIVCGILYFTSQPSVGARQVVAEFDDAFPLIEGMHVRVDGAIAGSVGTIDVNERGNAEVQLNLTDSIEPARADATASIRQQDTTGDSYVDFEPGTADEPLPENTIVCETDDRCDRTLVAPRLDDLLNAFGPAERAGVQLILVELAKGLEARGGDLNEATLSLRPAIEEANEALAEVGSQNEALGKLIESAERVTGQAARSDRELAKMIDSLAVTLHVTAGEADALDAGLERLPETTEAARTTLASLAGAAEAGLPLAQEVAAGAPDLASAIDRLPGFLDNASGFLDDTRSTVDLTRDVLDAAEPTLKIGNKRVLTGPFDLTGATADLLNSVLGGEDAFPALFGDDSYGVGEGTLGKRGFGGVAVEPGDLDGYPAEHADRRWLRVSAVINCEVFGVPVEPGCINEVLGTGRSGGGGGLRGASRGIREQLEAVAGGGSRRGGSGAGASGQGPDVPGAGNITDRLPEDLGGRGRGGRGRGDRGGGGRGGSGGGLRELPEIELPGFGGFGG